MKLNSKIRLLIASFIALLFSQQILFAQKWDEGLATIPGPFTNILGTSVANPAGVNKRDIRFVTFGVERMRLIGEIGTNQGFLGVNTITPNQRVHIGQGSLGVEDGFGIVGATYFPGQLDMIQFQNARINMIVRNKTLGIFCENFGGTPDDVKLADGTDVNTTISALNSAGLGRGIFQRGSNGNIRVGEYMTAIPALNHIQMDVIAKAINQTRLTPLNQYDVIFQGKISDDTASFIRMQNATNTNGAFVPLLRGHNNTNGTFQGFIMSGSINPLNDNLNATATMEFDTRTYDLATDAQTTVNNKNLFAWCNFTVPEMTMDASGQLGIRTVAPNNRLEIRTVLGDPFFGSANGSSGLRFSNMRGGVGAGFAVPVANPGPGVLTVNGNGDVIYVPGTLGNLCGALVPNPLPGNWEIPMADFNYHFSDNASTANGNKVGIGTNCGPLNAKLVVKNSVMQFGIDATTSTANFSTDFGIRGNATNNFPGGFEAIGVEGNAINAGPVFNTGVNGNASGAVQTNYGGKFQAFSPSGTNMGIQANGFGATGTNYGVNANGNAGFTAIGVNGTAGGGTSANYGVLGIANTTNPANRAGKFVGVLESTSGTVVVSDQMFKTNVDAIKSASEILRKLKPHTYKMDVINFPQFNFTDVKQYGFIAQEIETVLPELVQESVSLEEKDSLGNIIHPAIAYKSLNYNALIPITVQAVNELGGQVSKTTLSDQTIKTNVQNLSGSLAKVKQMRGVTYEWSTTAQDNIGLDSLQHIGFIAQEIEAIEPLLTFVDDSSLMHVNYDRVVPMLVESIKDLDAQIQTKDSIIAYKDSLLDARMTVLENALNACCNSSHSMQPNNNSNNSIAQQDVNLKDGQTVVLEANVPNPFSEQTTINYFLPENIVKAQMLFYNISGKLIQSVDLNERGKCSLNVFAQDLSNGIYTYTLVVDGKVIETKKMVKQQ